MSALGPDRVKTILNCATPLATLQAWLELKAAANGSDPHFGLPGLCKR